MKGGEIVRTANQGRTRKSECMHSSAPDCRQEMRCVRFRLKQQHSARLSLDPFQLLSHLCPAYLGIASGGLDRRSSFHSHMAKIVGNFFQCPSGFSRTMSEIMPQVMKREITNQSPLLLVGPTFQRPEPMVNACLSQLVVPLRRKHIGTALITTTVPKIVIKGASGFIEQINITEFLPFVSHMEPPNLGSNMGMLHA